MPADPLRVAIVGSSGHGQRVAAPTIRSCPGAVLLGGFGSSAAGSRAFAAHNKAPKSWHSLDHMLADDDVEAVWICSPNSLHADHVVAAAAAGKHVLVEKPLAISSADAERAVAAARSAGVVLRVGYQHRFRPAHLRIHELLHAGEIGRIGYVRIHRFWPYPYYPDMPPEPPAWRRVRETSGGWAINDIGTHLIDLAQWLTGLRPRLIGAALASQKFDVATEDSAAILLGFGEATIGLVEASAANPSPSSRIELYGSDGWLRADDTFWSDCRIETQRGVVAEYPRIDHLVPYGVLFADFVQAARGGTSMAATGEDGAAVAAVIQDALDTGTKLRRAQFGA